MTAPVTRHARVTTVIDQARAWLPLVTTGTLVLIFLGATVCSLIFSANATMDYAVAHHVPDAIKWTPVGMLELVQIAGTIWWLSARGLSRLGAVVMVVGIAAVNSIMVSNVYTWLGLLPGVLAVSLIHAMACVLRAHVTPASAEAEQGPELVSLDGWTKASARKRAAELRVSQAGTVREIVSRINEAEKRLGLAEPDRDTGEVPVP